MVRTLGRRIKDELADRLSLDFELPPRPSPRYTAVEKVSRNALSELIGRAKSHPQTGIKNSANPAYAALADLTEEANVPGLALGLRHETGEITFLDLNMEAALVEQQGGAYVGRPENLALWRRLEELIFLKVDSTMVGPRKPIRPPYEV